MDHVVLEIDLHLINNIPVEKIIYTTVKVREDLDTKKAYEPIFTTY